MNPLLFPMLEMLNRPNPMRRPVVPFGFHWVELILQKYPFAVKIHNVM